MPSKKRKSKVVKAVKQQSNKVKQNTSGFAITALVLGILGIFLAPLSILAIIFGAVSLSRLNKNHNLQGRGMAVAGLVLGIIGTLIWIISILVITYIFRNLANSLIL